MGEEKQIVLPDTLVAQLIENAAELSEHLQQDFAQVVARREAIRSKLISDGQIIKVDTHVDPLDETYVIDGAHLAEVDRASAYSASCAVSVGQEERPNDQSSCLAILPHVPCLDTLSSGLMMMQEVMMAVKVIENYPDAICLIDGSKISAIIRINEFYTGISRDLSSQIRDWRRIARQDSNREPAKTIALFESRDWLTPYLTNCRVIGNLKLVTTTILIEKYASDWVGRFDDKTLAALILEDGEALNPVPLQYPSSPYHVKGGYPFSDNLSAIENQFYQAGHNNQFFHIYYRPDTSHGVFKVETNKAFLDKPEWASKLLSWWRKEISAPDLLEPYSYYIADRFAKESVRVAQSALKEINRRQTSVAPWAWFFTQPYRTE